MQRYRSVTQPDRKRAPEPAQAAHVRVAPLLPPAELRRLVRVPELHLAARRARRDDVRLARGPLDADQPVALSLLQLEQMRDFPGVQVLVVHVQPTRHGDGVSR